MKPVKRQVQQIAAKVATAAGLLGIAGIAAVGYYAFTPPSVNRLSLPKYPISLELECLTKNRRKAV